MPWNKIAKTKTFLVITFKALFLCAIVIAALASGIVIWAFQFKLQSYPVYIYSAPARIPVGADIHDLELAERLKRLGYKQTSSSHVGLGEWRLSDLSVAVNFRKPPFPSFMIIQGPVNISVDTGKITEIRLMRSQQQVNEIFIEPEILHIIPAKGYPASLCRFKPLDEIPPLLVEAIIQTEDSNFFSHHGIDWASFWLAIKSNLEAGRYVQGGSTITQQLIKMTLLSNEKTIWRKMNEIVLSIAADAIYSKKTILESYLNRVYFGQLGAFPINGVHEAASELLGKSLDELDASDCAFLAATIRAPNVINPFRHPERAIGRRNIILGLLLKIGKITREEYDEALSKPIVMQRPGSVPVKVPNLVETLSSTEEMIVASNSQTNRFVVTTIDPLIQLRLDTALRKFTDPSMAPQVIVTSPETGNVIVFFAPADYKNERIEASLDLFSPFVLVPAFSPDRKSAPKYSLNSQFFTKDAEHGSATILDSFRIDRGSLTSRMIETLGPQTITDVFNETGIYSNLTGSGAIKLNDINIGKVAEIYSVAANLGDYTKLSFIYPPTGKLGPAATTARKVSLNPAAIYLMNHMLKTVVKPEDPDSIGLNLNRTPSKIISVDTNGVWGIIYNSEALMVIRLNGDIKDTGKLSSLMDYVMEPLLERTTTSNIPVGILFRRICSESGLRATSICAKVSFEPFLTGTLPHEWCPLRHEVDPKKGVKPKTN